MKNLLKFFVKPRETVIVIAEPTPDFSKEMVIIEIPEKEKEEDEDLPKIK